MTDKQFYTTFSAAIAADDRDAFVSDWALSSIWEDSEGADIPQDRIDQLGQIWDVAHLPVKDIRKRTGLIQAEFATRFCIPARTLEDWERGARKCPDYLRLLLAQAVGAYHRG